MFVPEHVCPVWNAKGGHAQVWSNPDPSMGQIHRVRCEVAPHIHRVRCEGAQGRPEMHRAAPEMHRAAPRCAGNAQQESNSPAPPDSGRAAPHATAATTLPEKRPIFLGSEIGRRSPPMPHWPSNTQWVAWRSRSPHSVSMPPLWSRSSRSMAPTERPRGRGRRWRGPRPVCGRPGKRRRGRAQAAGVGDGLR